MFTDEQVGRVIATTLARQGVEIDVLFVNGLEVFVVFSGDGYPTRFLLSVDDKAGLVFSGGEGFVEQKFTLLAP